MTSDKKGDPPETGYEVGDTSGSCGSAPVEALSIEVPDALSAQNLALWCRYLQIADPASARQDYRRDPEMDASGFRLRDGSTPTNLFAWMKEQVEELPALLAKLRQRPDFIRDPALESLPDELFFELIALGEPVDRMVSGFSASLYYDQHHDIARSGSPAIVHYLRWGHREAMRLTPVKLRNRARLVRPAATDPILLIATPDPLTAAGESVTKALAKLARKVGLTPVFCIGSADAETFSDDTSDPDPAAILSGDLPVWQLRALAGQLPQELVAAVDLSGGGLPSLCYECEAAGIPLFAAPLSAPAGAEKQRREALLLTYAHGLISPDQEIARAWQLFGRTVGIRPGSLHLAPASVFVPSPEGDNGVQEAAVHRTLTVRFGAEWRAHPLVLASGPAAGVEVFRALAQTMRVAGSEAHFLWITLPGPRPDVADDQDSRDHAAMPAGVGAALEIWQTPSLLPVLAGFCSHYLSFHRSTADNTAILLAAQAGAQVAICGEASEAMTLAREAGLSDRLRSLPVVDILALYDFLMTEKGRDRAGSTPLPPFGPTFAKAVLKVVQDHAKERGGPVHITRFHPVICDQARLLPARRRNSWLSIEDCRAEIARSDNWLHRMLKVPPPEQTRILHGSAPYALHHHVFYPAQITGTVRQHLATYRNARRVVFSVPSAASAARLREALRGLMDDPEIVVTANLGRDILPFLRLLYDDFVAAPALWWGHVHQKRSAHLPNGLQWRDHLLTTLLSPPSRKEAAPVVGIDLSDTDLGVIAPFCNVAKIWGPSARHLPLVEGAFTQPLPDEPMLFPAGNMFFCRGAVAKAMLDLFGYDYPWPEEPLALDGTEYHLIERLWPTVAAKCGYKSIFLDFFNLQ